MTHTAIAVVFFLVTANAAVAQQTSADSPAPPIGYSSVAAALEDLKTRRDVSISVQGGWTIVSEPAIKSLWSFTPDSHPAHPAVVRRTVIQRGDEILINMKGLCQASKDACDKLMAEFEALNAQMRENMKRR